MTNNHIDWRLPGARREAFGRFYDFHLATRAHPGMVYSFLPAIAQEFELDADERAWLVWLNGNTQNAVTSLLLLEQARSHRDWRKAVDFWNENFTSLEWDTDRRHQKSKFGEATEKWVSQAGEHPSRGWEAAGLVGWGAVWSHAVSQPYMGRLSAWSMSEYARILFGADVVPDAEDFMFRDHRGSNSHRNGLHVVLGHDATYWKAGQDTDKYLPDEEMEDEADALLREALDRNAGKPWFQDVSRLTMESAFCTYKSWHKPNRRYPGVYADMMYLRIRKAEARFGRTFPLLWGTRLRDLPDYLRLEDNPTDPGLSRVKQNHYLETGEIPVLGRYYDDMELSTFDLMVDLGSFGNRKDPK